MKERPKDILLIALALVAILGCGFGLGSQFAPKKKIDPTPPSVAVDNMEEVTLSNLKAVLSLTAEQEEAIRSDVAATRDEVVATRKRALFEYHLQILRLHDKIAPRLDPEQRTILEKNRKLLQDTIEKRFPNLLDDLPPSSSGQLTTRNALP